MDLIGTISVDTKDSSWELAVSAIAYSHGGNGNILFLSAAGPQTAAKAVAAALNLNGQGKWRLMPRYEDADDQCPHRMLASRKEGYRTSLAKLGLDTYHLLAVSKCDQLIQDSDACLWRELLARTTTPMLRQWVPWLKVQLEEKRLICEQRCYNCAWAAIRAETKDLDDIVSAGLQDGHITITKGG